MAGAAMTGFRRCGRGQTVTIRVNGEAISAQAGESVALALLAAGHGRFGVRSSDGSAYGPYCLMGVCFRCQCRIDGRPGEQACMVPVRDGLEVMV